MNQSPQSFESFVLGLESCLLYSGDESADAGVSMRLFEQISQIKPTDLLKASAVTVKVFKEFLAALLELLRENPTELELQAPEQLSQFCFGFMKSFFEDKKSEGTDYFIPVNGMGQDAEVNDIIMKIELKKFQKLIENRVQKKNSLLTVDRSRIYPYSKFP